MSDLTTWIKTLKEVGLKNTKHRIEILRILEKAGTPVSADQMYARLKKTDILISLSTVYRTLETLIEKELVSKVQFDSESKALYEINQETHHHHFICLACNKIFTLEHCPVHEADFDLKELDGFNIIGHKLEFFGYCKACEKKLHKPS